MKPVKESQARELWVLLAIYWPPKQCSSLAVIAVQNNTNKSAAHIHMQTVRSYTTTVRQNQSRKERVRTIWGLNHAVLSELTCFEHCHLLVAVHASRVCFFHSEN